MKSNKEVFTTAFKNQFSKMTLTPELMKDANKYIGGLKEDNYEDEDSDTTLSRKKGKASAKDQFKSELQSDPDFIRFKKNAKYDVRGSEYTFGTPNVSVDDPYISKKKYSRVSKSEPKEATSTGSSGSYEPLFSGEEPKKVETKEATTSVGGYQSPAMWAKTTSKKDWGPSRKPQLPGGSFVSVKEKCTKFPYCNQGDIKSLKIYKNKTVKESIKNVASKLNLNETTIKAILEYEMEKVNKTKK